MKAAPCQEVVLTATTSTCDLLPGMHSLAGRRRRLPQPGPHAHQAPGDRRAQPRPVPAAAARRRAPSACTGRSTRTRPRTHAVAERRGERLPVAIAFGCPPAVTYAATAPLPADIDEYLFAGFLQRERVELVDCLIGAAAGAGARRRSCSRAGSSRASGCPRARSATTPASTRRSSRSRSLHVDAMTMRTDPIFQSIVVGRPPQEDGPIGQGHRADLPAADPDDHAGDRRLRPARGGRVPQLRDRLDRQALPEARAEGDERDLGRRAAVAVEADRRRGRRLRRARLRRGGLAGVRQRRLRARRAAHRRARSTISTTPSYEQFCGGKLGIDATRKLPTEGYHRDGGWPRECRRWTRRRRGTVDQRWEEYGIRRGVDGGAGDRTAARDRTRSARRRSGPGRDVPAAGDDRALGLRAAVRLHRRADRDVAAERARSTGCSCC